MYLLVAAPLRSAETDTSSWAEAKSRFIDPKDGWLDVSGFLDTAYGFVPLVIPITEPAVGYGAAGALVFIDRKPPDASGREQRPNVAVVGALGTENGTQGAFAAHLGTWLDGRLHTLVGVADADVNLDFFGLGSDRTPRGSGVPYTVSARGALAGGNYKLGESSFWVGLRYALAKTTLSFDLPPPNLPGIATTDSDLRLGALTPSLTFDTRDNFFSPTRGWYLDVSVPVFSEAFGSDRDFEKATLTAIRYQPLSRSLFFSARGTASASSDGTPFYLRPFVMLRGVQALRYQGDQAGEVEGELRWQFLPRFSLVGFGGAGAARGADGRTTSTQTVTSGGAGFRYLIARTYGLQLGMDVGFGPNEPILYVVFGTAWIRP